MFAPHRPLFLAISALIAIGGTVIGQTADPMDQRLPFEVKLSEKGLEVVAYDNSDGVLQIGDLISWVTTPDSDDKGVEVASVEDLRAQVLERCDQEGRIAIWITRGNEDPVWVIVNVGEVGGPAPAIEQTMIVKAVDGGVEVVEYSGEDGLLQPGDVITWVATPGSDESGGEVTDPESFQAELQAQQDSDRNVALYVQRPGSEADWIIVPLVTNYQNQAETPLPLTVKETAGGMEIISFNGSESLLQPGGVISLIMSPDSDEPPREATSPAEFEQIVRSMQRANLRVKFWVERDGDTNWVDLPLTLASSSHLELPTSLVVQDKDGQLQVESYLGNDDALQPGDVILWVATPDSDDEGIAVKSLAEFNDQVVAKQDSQGMVALWVQRGDSEPDWVIMPIDMLSADTLGEQLAFAERSAEANEAFASRGGDEDSADDPEWGLPFTVTVDDEGLKVLTSNLGTVIPGDVLRRVWQFDTPQTLLQSTSDLEWYANKYKDKLPSFWVLTQSKGREYYYWYQVPLTATHRFANGILRPVGNGNYVEDTITYHINHTSASGHKRLIPGDWGQNESLVAVAEDDPAIKDFWKQKKYRHRFSYVEGFDIGKRLDSFGWQLEPVSDSSNLYRIRYGGSRLTSTLNDKRLLYEVNGSCAVKEFKRDEEENQYLHWCISRSDDDTHRFIIRNAKSGAYLALVDGKVTLSLAPQSIEEIEWQIGAPEPSKKQKADTDVVVAGGIYCLGSGEECLTTSYHPQVGIMHAYDERAQWIFVPAEDGSEYFYMINYASGMALTEEGNSWSGGRIVDRPRFAIPRLASSVLPFSVEDGRPGQSLKVINSSDKGILPGDIIRQVREPDYKHRFQKLAESSELKNSAQLDEETLRCRGYDGPQVSLIDLYVERDGKPVNGDGWVKRVVLQKPPFINPYRQQWKLSGIELINRATGNPLSAYANKCLPDGMAYVEHGELIPIRIRGKMGSAADVAVVRFDEITCQRPSVGMDNNTKFLFKVIDFAAEKAILPSSGPGFGTILKRSFAAVRAGAGTGLKAGAGELAKQSKKIITREFVIKQAKIYAVKKTVKEQILHARNRAQGNKSRLDFDVHSPEVNLAQLALPDVIGPESDEVRTDDSISETLFAALGGKDVPDQIYLKMNGVGVWPFIQTAPLDDMTEDVFSSNFWKAIGNIVIGRDKAGYYYVISQKQTVPLNLEFVFRKSKGVAIELMEWDVGKKGWDITPGLFGTDHDSLGVIELPTMGLEKTEKIENAIVRNSQEGSLYEMTFSARPLISSADTYAGKKAGEERPDGFYWCEAGVYSIGTPLDQYPSKINQKNLQIHRSVWPPLIFQNNEMRPVPGAEEIVDLRPGSKQYLKDYIKDQVILELSRGCWLSKNEITVQEYFDITGNFAQASLWGVYNADKHRRVDDGSGRNFPGANNFPGFNQEQTIPEGAGAAILKDDPTLANSVAEQLSLEEMKLYCDKLTSKYAGEGKLPSGWRFVVASEAQWRFPALIGNKTEFRFSDHFELRGDCAWVRTDIDATKSTNADTTAFRQKYAETRDKLGFRVALVRNE